MFNFIVEDEGQESPFCFILFPLDANPSGRTDAPEETEELQPFKVRIKNSMFGYQCDFVADVRAKDEEDAIRQGKAIDGYAEVSIVEDEPRRAGDLGEFLARSLAQSLGADADAVFTHGCYVDPSKMGYNNTPGAAGWPHSPKIQGGDGGSSYDHSSTPFSDLLDSLKSMPDQSDEIEPGVLPDDLARFDVDWTDVSSEDFREYERPGGGFYTIEDPRWLYISPTKNHYVIDIDGMVHVIHADMSRPILRWVADPILDWLPTS